MGTKSKTWGWDWCYRLTVTVRPGSVNTNSPRTNWGFKLGVQSYQPPAILALPRPKTKTILVLSKRDRTPLVANFTRFSKR